MRTSLPKLPRAPRPAALAAAAAGVAGLAAAVMLSATVDRLDVLASAGIHAHAAQAGAELMLAVSALAGTSFVWPITFVAAALLVALRHWQGALLVLMSVALSQVAVALLKHLVARPRPADESSIVDPSGFSFPSAHSATSVALYASLGLVAASACRGRARVAVALVTAGVVLAVGASRIYLGAHYPTDVLAGWLTGGALVLACWLGISALRAPARTAA